MDIIRNTHLRHCFAENVLVVVLADVLFGVVRSQYQFHLLDHTLQAIEFRQILWTKRIICHKRYGIVQRIMFSTHLILSVHLYGRSGNIVEHSLMVVQQLRCQLRMLRRRRHGCYSNNHGLVLAAACNRIHNHIPREVDGII